MKTLLSRGLLTVLTLTMVAALLPAPATASFWCNSCENTGDCFACCKCDGGTARQCADECGSAATAIGDVSFLNASTCDAPLMTIASPASEVEAAAPADESTPAPVNVNHEPVEQLAAD